jgi:hypothetical protein
MMAVWSEAGRLHDSGRATKRLKSRILHVRNSEQKYAEKKEHCKVKHPAKVEICLLIVVVNHVIAKFEEARRLLDSL